MDNIILSSGVPAHDNWTSDYHFDNKNRNNCLRVVPYRSPSDPLPERWLGARIHHDSHNN